MEIMWQLVYDQFGVKSHIGSPFQYWNDACWDRCVPSDTTGLSYLDVGCCNGLYPLRFHQSGGDATGIDCVNGLITDATKIENLGAPIEENIKSFKRLKKEFQADYKGIVGGFDSYGQIHPLYGETYDIVSCMNTIEYIDPLGCIDSLKAKTRQRLIICTDITDNKTYNLPIEIKCIISNPEELIRHTGWKCTAWYWTPETHVNLPKQGFFVFENPDSKLPPFDITPPTYNIDLAETQKNRSRRGR